MALAFYVKKAQGNFTRHLASRSLFAALSSTSGGGALYGNRRAFSMQVLTAERHSGSTFSFLNDQEKKLVQLLKQKRELFTELKCPRLDLDPEDKAKCWENHLLYKKKLWEKEGQLLDVLERTKEEIENLCSTLNMETIVKVSDLVSKDEAARLRHDKFVERFDLMRKASQYFDFVDYLTNNCNFIKHTSSPKEILKIMGKELHEKFPFVDDDLLQLGVYNYVGRLSDVYIAELRCNFNLFLLRLNMKFRNGLSPDYADAMEIQQLEEFRRQFTELDESDVQSGLNMYYRFYMVRQGDEHNLKWRSAYEEAVRTELESMTKHHMQISFPLNDDQIFKMVFQTWKKGYRMDIFGDPETEVEKLEKYSEEIENATTQDDESSKLHVKLSAGFL